MTYKNVKKAMNFIVMGLELIYYKETFRIRTDTVLFLLLYNNEYKCETSQ